jgi:hypothetical protein
MMVTLKDLDGKPGLTRAEFVENRTAALRVARTGKAATSAGDNGAINIWRDRRGQLHARFSRYRVTENYAKGMTLGDLGAWLKKWWPEMGVIG